MARTPIITLIIVAFLINTFGPLPAQAQGGVFLPAPGIRVSLSLQFNPPVLKGLKIHPDNPFRFDFILDKGDSTLANDQLKEESSKLIKYFLASLTVPEKDLWVNLSPYEKDRIVPKSFGQTEMGRDLLAQDYLLKQITASLIYPEDEFGKKFWKRVYEEASKKFGTTNIPVNTFNKVWIIPEKAVVYENAKAGTAYVVESKLKVMLEQDYLALEKGLSSPKSSVGDPGHGNDKDVNALGSQIVREIVIPELTKEVNENKNFAQLRQVYNSLILATWYKKKIKDSILSQVYADKNKVKGVEYTDSVIPAKAGIQNKGDVEGIYQQYLQAFKKGVYNYIKEETDPTTQQIISKKYFSGGFNLAIVALEERKVFSGSEIISRNKAMLVEVRVEGLNDKAMLSEAEVEDHAKIIFGEAFREHLAELAEINKQADYNAQSVFSKILELRNVLGSEFFRHWPEFRNSWMEHQEGYQRYGPEFIFAMSIRFYQEFGNNLSAYWPELNLALAKAPIARAIVQFGGIIKSREDLRDILKELNSIYQKAHSSEDYFTFDSTVTLSKIVHNSQELKDISEELLTLYGSTPEESREKMSRAFGNVVHIILNTGDIREVGKELQTILADNNDEYVYDKSVSLRGLRGNIHEKSDIKKSWNYLTELALYMGKEARRAFRAIEGLITEELINTQEDMEKYKRILWEMLRVDVTHSKGSLTKRPNEKPLRESDALQDFFQEVWSDYIIGLANKAENIDNLARTLVDQAKHISNELGSVVEEMVSVVSKDKREREEFIKRWSKFEEEHLVPLGYHVLLYLIEKGKDEFMYEAIVYKLEHQEERLVGGESVVTVYGKKVDNVNLHPSGGHSINGKRFVFINSDIDSYLAFIEEVRQGVKYLQKKGADFSPTVNPLIRDFFLQYNGEHLKKLYFQRIRAHEYGHQAQDMKGAKYNKEDRFGLPYGIWNTLFPYQRESIDRETVAHLSEFILADDPKYALIDMIDKVFFSSSGVETGSIYEFSALWILHNLVDSERKPSLKDWFSYSKVLDSIEYLFKLDPEELRSLALQLMENNWSKELAKIVAEADAAMVKTTTPGGIDFNADKIGLQIQNDGESIRFKMDPTMLQQLQNAPGFVPVVISIQPMENLALFLGLDK